MKTIWRIWTITAVFAVAALTLLPAARVSAADRPEGMFALYEANRKAGIPNYITEDFLLLSYGMVVNRTLTDMEEAVLLPELTALTAGLMQSLAELDRNDPAVAGGRNFAAVLHALLTGAKTADGAADPAAADEELRRIREAGGIGFSDLMQQQIDYSQFKVRGKYAESPELGRYFRAVKYAGTVLFPVVATQATDTSPEQADRLTRQALLLTRLMAETPDLEARRRTIENRLSWLFGPPDDLTVADYRAVADRLGKAPTAEIRAALLAHARRTGRRPTILAGVVKVDALEKGVTPEDALTGWRFLPQRYAPDSAVFQRVVFDEVGRYGGDKAPFSLAQIEGKPVKGFPLGLELMAFLGADAAGAILADADERGYEGYGAAADEARKILKKGLRARNLVADHMGILQQWLTGGQGPRSAAGPRRRLNTALGFWTFDRYMRILYTKQSYTSAGKAIDLTTGKRSAAWLEPAPALYRRLGETALGVAGGLSAGTQNDRSRTIRERLTQFANLMDRCREISQGELTGAPLAADEAAFLNDLDETLLDLVEEPDGPIVVDVHTEPTSGQVLEEGLGYPRIVEHSLGGDVSARGGLFNYYEFKHPLENRLTDQEWADMLFDGAAPEGAALSPGSSAHLNP